MIELIYGGSGSGKSAFAENEVLRLSENKNRIYVATMKNEGKESQERILRHRALRKDKGFITIEKSENLGEIANQIPENSTVLLECLSNLVANEMFKAELQVQKALVVEKVLQDLAILFKKTSDFVIVSNNIFDDGIYYEESTRNYMAALSEINRKLAEVSDKVFEVVTGIPLTIKAENL